MGKSAAHGSNPWGKSLMQMENTNVTCRFARTQATHCGQEL